MAKWLRVKPQFKWKKCKFLLCFLLPFLEQVFVLPFFFSFFLEKLTNFRRDLFPRTLYEVCNFHNVFVVLRRVFCFRQLHKSTWKEEVGSFYFWQDFSCVQDFTRNHSASLLMTDFFSWFRIWSKLSYVSLPLTIMSLSPILNHLWSTKASPHVQTHIAFHGRNIWNVTATSGHSQGCSPPWMGLIWAFWVS